MKLKADNLSWEISDELPKITSWLTINRVCNLRCKWCYSRNNRTGSMSLETVEKSIKLLRGLPTTRVILIGGEPTIHPNFLTIIKMVKEAGLMPVVVTNGIKFKDEVFLRKALDAGLSAITVSLKATNNDQYQLFTGHRSFNDTMEAIKNIDKNGISNRVSITVGEDLLESSNEIIDVIVESKAQIVSLEMERPTIIDDKILSSDSASLKKIADFFINLYPKLESSGVNFVINVSIPFCLFPRSFIETLIKKGRITSGCQIHTGSGIIIDPNGKLLPCNHFCNNALGELGQDFISGEEYLLFRQRPDISQFYKTLSSYPHEKCQSCDQWQQCGGGCRIRWLHQGVNTLIDVL